MVKLRAGSTAPAKYHLKILESFELNGREPHQTILRLKLPEGMSVPAALNTLSHDVSVEFVEPNYILEPQELKPSPRMPETKVKWGHESSSVAPNNGPIVAVLDTGVEVSHPDLVDSIWRNPKEIMDGLDNDGNGVIDDLWGYNAHHNNGDVTDTHSHGTHVAGIVAGKSQPTALTNPSQVQIMPIKIYDEHNVGDVAAAVRGVIYASRMGARITVNAWGGTPYSKTLEEAFRSCPALHIMAAGNESRRNEDRPDYPAAYHLHNAVVVGATDNDGDLAGFSNFGEAGVDIAAPGENILSTMPGGTYGKKSGTSMAAPLAGAVAASVLAEFPQVDTEQVKHRLLGGALERTSLRGLVKDGRLLNQAGALSSDITPPVPPEQVAGKAGPFESSLTWTPSAEVWRYEVTESGRGEVAFLPSQNPSGVTIPLMPASSPRKLLYQVSSVDRAGNRSSSKALELEVPRARITFEGRPGDWEADTKWALVDTPERKAVWSDSPDGPYTEDADSSLVSKPFDLCGLAKPQLFFESRQVLERGGDSVSVEVTEDGKAWRTLAQTTGTQDWKVTRIALPPLRGNNIRVRFRLRSDQAFQADGFYLAGAVVADAEV